MVPTHLFMNLFLLTCFICRSLLDTTNDTANSKHRLHKFFWTSPALSTFVTLVEYSLTISEYQTCEQVKCRFARGVLATSVLSNPMYMNMLIRSTTRSHPSDLKRISFIPVYKGRQYLSLLHEIVNFNFTNSMTVLKLSAYLFL